MPPPPTPHTATLYSELPVNGGIALSSTEDVYLEAMLAPGLMIGNGIGLIFRDINQGTVRAVVIHDRMSTPVAVVLLEDPLHVEIDDRVRIAARTLVLELDPQFLGGEQVAPPLIQPIDGWLVAPQISVVKTV